MHNLIGHCCSATAAPQPEYKSSRESPVTREVLGTLTSSKLSKMEQKTWFLPPDFTFRPDSELALGTVIRHPKRPTLSLASLNADLPPHVTLPPVNISSEANHNHGTGSNQSFGAEILSKFAHLASSAGLNVMYDKERIFDNVDHEIRTYDSALSPETLEAIMELPRVREYMKYGRFGLRSVCKYHL